MIIADRLRAARLGRGLSQDELAWKAGLHKNVIQCYERGRSIPGAKNLVTLADALEVSLDWLCGREGRKYDH